MSVVTTVLETTKLIGEDLDIWNSYLLATRLLFEELDRRLTEHAGISLPDYIVLFRLSQADEDGMRMGELAQSAVFSPSRISHAVRRLEAEGWVERRTCPTDRRGSYGFLTESGTAKLRASEPIHTEVVRRHFLDQVVEPDGFRATTDRMRNSLGAGPTDPAC